MSVAPSPNNSTKDRCFDDIFCFGQITFPSKVLSINLCAVFKSGTERFKQIKITWTTTGSIKVNVITTTGPVSYRSGDEDGQSVTVGLAEVLVR